MTDKETLINKARKWLTNKYLIVILVFAVIYVFVSDQSLIKRMQRGKQIHQIQEQLRTTRADTEHARHMLEVLQDTDSLEQFAREKYGMHANNEDVYRVNE